MGFIFWIHPTGLAIVAASFISIGVFAYKEKKYKSFVFHVLFTSVLVILYQSFFHDWVNKSMTPIGYTPVHHYGGIANTISALTSLKVLVGSFVIFIGTLSYLTISSFGIFFIGIYFSIKKIFNSLLSGDVDNKISLILFFYILSVFFVIGMGSVMFASTTLNGAMRIDHWIYGRYVEPIILLFLAIGFIIFKTLKIRVRIIISVLSFSLLMITAINGLHIPTESHNNLLNTPAFWPQYLFENLGLSEWMAIGSVVVLFSLFLNRKLLFIMMFLSSILCVYNQYQFHKEILNSYSKPSSFIKIIQQNYAKDSCIGFDVDFPANMNLYQKERFNLYQFYLKDFQYRRFSLQEWKKSCNGPFLTYNVVPLINNDNYMVLAKEIESGLFLVDKKQNNKINGLMGLSGVENDILLASSVNYVCLYSGCFSADAKKLSNKSQVGMLDNNTLITTSKAGHLFYGPYTKIKKGHYKLVITGDFKHAKGAYLDIVSNLGRDEHLGKDICSVACPVESQLTFPFTINTDISDLEVRLSVSAEDNVRVYGYEVIMDQNIKP
ncbi:hypothetical protein [Yersinia pseudotuberculosis]|uniref:Uncharacterized protein n=2 Tax=Yersinia pseudotuberculosis TaxID=633 RepID=A0A380QAY5_YERPU|nr:hypothetical protein [Yersinia pseudotuberculosis]SUP84652.1 Uncharacterised protein [Yersinia pseudotuberculosis]